MKELPFGAYIRQLREAENMPLRKLAAVLDIDTSTLSKIERQERDANSNMVPIIAEVFNLDFKKLQIRFWSEKIYDEIAEEVNIIEVLESVLFRLRAKLIEE